VTSVAAKIETLLKETMGLHAASIGSASVDRAVRARIAACGAATLGAYWARLQSTPAELQELIEAVVVPETWFFREPAAFAEVGRVARDEWLATQSTEVRRLLSIPCSTGEEPYSIAMALLDSGYPSERFAIDAVDISERSLAHARRAVYGTNSFRGDDLAFRDRHFEKTPQGYRVNDAVRQRVRFHKGNVSAEDFLAGAKPYDAIFCRNLLIYFDESTQAQAVATLHRLLLDGGVLFVGPAEPRVLLDHEFVSVKVPLAFGFRKPAAASTPSSPPSTRRRPSPPKPAPRTATNVLPVPSPTPPRAAGPRPALNGHTAAAPRPGSRIDEAFALADRGCFTEATALCEAQLQEHGPSAQAFYLLGLICSAEGRLYAADRCYRKALYLDSGHHDALVHLALLLEQQGETHEAKLLRSRAQKL
jgi:chemotaxis protein methyltransferase WspC